MNCIYHFFNSWLLRNSYYNIKLFMYNLYYCNLFNHNLKTGSFNEIFRLQIYTKKTLVHKLVAHKVVYRYRLLTIFKKKSLYTSFYNRLRKSLN